MKYQGLSHVHIVVRDLERSVRFYTEAFGLKEVFRKGEDMVFLQTPGRAECLTLKREDSERVGQNGGVDHFGFPLADPARDIDAAIAEVERAGGRLLGREELAPGVPTAFFADPDGYCVQI